ncbi:MAG TPA: amidohydrolase family protein [Candidatus Acidoferrales bacterium]|nr:amidohydrolase family protein [Candidatus Acidoferrales bacterium]
MNSARNFSPLAKLGFLLYLFAFAIPAFAQSAGSSSGVYAIKGAKVFPVSGAPIDNGVVVIRDGKIAAVGKDVAIPDGAQVIDATGLQVYPGVFDPATQIGLEEVGAVNATVDTDETGLYNPDVVAATAFNADSAHVPVTRAAGITEVLTIPGSLGGFGGFGGGGVIGGQGSAVNLGGWNVNDMVIRRSAVMELSWPSIQTGSFDFSTFSFTQKPFAEAKKEYDKHINELSDLLDKARHYAEAMEKGSPDKFERDLKLESLVPVVEGKEPLFVVAFAARDIRNAVEFCAKQKLRMILGGASEAWKVTDVLKKNNVPVIIGPVLSLPQSEDDAYDSEYTLPETLHAAGIPIAFGSFDTSFSRRLTQYAGTSVGYGLPYDEALKAVTVNAAQMLGLDSEIGTLEPGKLANIVVTDGDLLEIRTQVKYLFIKGQLASLDNKHLELYKRYSSRPKPSQP